MTFLHPLALLGLVAAGIPAVLHLLERRTPPEADFPPLRYLSEAERRSARRLRLRHMLLLVLRTALVVVIVLAAARPLLPGPWVGDAGTRGRGGVGSTHAPTALVVILDNSPSSGAVVDGRPVLDRLKAAARGSLTAATRADRLWLVLADGVARGGSREALLDAVDSAAADPRRLDLSDALRRAVRLVDAEPLVAREVHVVSDLQRTALGAGTAEIPRGVRVLALAPPPPPPSPGGTMPANRGIAAARVIDGGGRAGGSAVAVSVAGTPGAGPAPLTVRLRGRDVGRALAGPGEGVTVPLPPAPSGWWVGEVALQPDELRADDRRLFVWRVAPPARVRAGPEVMGGAGGAGGAEGAEFVAVALAVLREAGRVAATGAGAGAAGGGGEVAIAEELRAGGAASVLLPPADPALVGPVNRALAARGVRWRFGAFPTGTPGRVAAPEGGLSMIASVQVDRRYPLEDGEADSADVLAAVNGEPWLVRDRTGAGGGGTVVLLGSRLDTTWTALPVTPGFVPFMDMLLNRVARGEAPIREAEGAARVEFEVRGADTVGATVYGPVPDEVDLTPASASVVRRALGAEVLDEADFMARRFAGARRIDLSGMLLALALVLAAVELGVATLTR